ncbi:MAG: cysteine desulfurase family protein [Candidatus Wallbacteria bacterium]|nr:cysteine desulfurase family protein [Candidatus Wallbacteria bacterium]
MPILYFDNAATTPLDPLVLREMLPHLKKEFGNPESPYSLGKRARSAVDLARTRVAELINSSPDEIIFTGSGTESNNLALKGTSTGHLAASAVEHHSVLESCRFLETGGARFDLISVDHLGRLNMSSLGSSLSRGAGLVSVMHANNEIGTIQPILEIGKACRDRRVILHVDAVQTFGHLKIDVRKMKIDLLSLSAHKIYGPKGVGALFIGSNVCLTSHLHGGEQERHLRASTHNVAGIVGLGMAAVLAGERQDQEALKQSSWQDMIRDKVLHGMERVRLNGDPELRLPGNLSFTFDFVDGKELIAELDRRGICASGGAACATSDPRPSHVLQAIGLPQDIPHGTLRLSLGRFNNDLEIEKLLRVLPGVIEKVRKKHPLYEMLF